jgi:hypothetical protein
MYILDVMETCENTVLLSVLPVVKTIMILIQIIVPITLIVASTIQFVQLTVNPELKDGFRKVLNKVVAAFIIFLIPTLINVVLGAVGESTEFSSCWNSARIKINTGGRTYVDIDHKPENTKEKEPTKPGSEYNQ